MASTTGILLIRVEHPVLARTLHEVLLPDDRVVDLMRRLLARLGQGDSPHDWELLDEHGKPLASDVKLADWLAGRASPPTLILRPTWRTIAEMEVPAESAKKENATEETRRLSKPVGPPAPARPVPAAPPAGSATVPPLPKSQAPPSEVTKSDRQRSSTTPPVGSPPPLAPPRAPAPEALGAAAAGSPLPPSALARRTAVPRSEEGGWSAPPTEALPGDWAHVSAHAETSPDATRAGGGRSFIERIATVRYYTRMNPQRVFPFLVTLTKLAVAPIAQKQVAQKASGPFQVEQGEMLEVEPVLPGCQCYPPRLQVRLSGSQELVARFHVVPLVLGRVVGAAVHVRQRGETIAEVQLDVKVVQRTWVLVSGCAAFLVPFCSAILKHFRLDFESQRQEGFDFYLTIARLLFDFLSPVGLTMALIFVTSMVYLATRPKSRDQFWELRTLPVEPRAPDPSPAATPAAQTI
jgi:hypothetical protein